jgi:hypothetical protein
MKSLVIAVAVLISGSMFTAQGQEPADLKAAAVAASSEVKVDQSAVLAKLASLEVMLDEVSKKQAPEITSAEMLKAYEESLDAMIKLGEADVKLAECNKKLLLMAKSLLPPKNESDKQSVYEILGWLAENLPTSPDSYQQWEKILGRVKFITSPK